MADADVDEYTFLCGYQRIRRYGSTSDLNSPVGGCKKYVHLIQHEVQPTDTLQNLQLKYNSSMFEIKRINKESRMECIPSCEVMLPEIGTASVKTKYDACQSPAVLSFTVRSDGKITSHSFAAGNDLEVRPLRNNYWQLNLRVSLREVENSQAHHAVACMETVRTGNLTCFMNGLIPNDASACTADRQHEANAGFLVVLLCVILVTCLLMVGVAVCTIMHRFYSAQKSSGSRKNSSASTEKTSMQCPLVRDPSTVCSLKFPEERLEVITEETDDEKEIVSEASSSGVESNGGKTSDELDSSKTSPTHKSFRASFIYKKDQVMLPSQLHQQRRNSQPMLFPISLSDESLKQIKAFP